MQMNKDLGKRLIVSMIGLMVLVSTIFFTGTKAVYSAEAPSNTKFASDSDLMNSYDLDSGSSLNTQQVFLDSMEVENRRNGIFVEWIRELQVIILFYFHQIY